MPAINYELPPFARPEIYALAAGRADALVFDFLTNRAINRDPVTPSENYNGTVDSMPSLTDVHAHTNYVLNTATGVWEPYAANVLVRKDGLGLQNSMSATNFCSRSWRMVSWGAVNQTVTAELGEVVPVAGQTVHSLTRNSTVANSNMSLSVTAAAIPVGANAILHCKVKKKTTGNLFGLRIQGTYPNRVDAVFNLDLGTVVFSAGSTYTNVAAGITGPDVNGYYRVHVAATIAGTDVGTIVLGPTDVASSAWEGPRAALSDCYIKEVQLETNAYAPPNIWPTPYIPTDGAQAPRSGNLVNLVLTPGRYAAGIAGWIKVNLVSSPLNGFIVNARSVTTGNNDRIGVIFSNAISNMTMQGFAGGVSQAQVLMKSPPTIGQQTLVFAAGPNYFKARQVGQVAATDLVGFYPTDMGLISFGSGTGTSSTPSQFVQKAGLYGGAVNDAVFDEIYALAAAA